jgi:hypothetical protein
MSKQTAVNFIVYKIFKHSVIPFNKENCPTLFKFIDQAKEMEKQQIIDAYVIGAKNQIYGVDLSGLEYYNKTFNK